MSEQDFIQILTRTKNILTFLRPLTQRPSTMDSSHSDSQLSEANLSSDEDSSSDESLIELPLDNELKMRILLKEFFVRALLLEDYENFNYTYETLLPKVSVKLDLENEEAHVTVQSNDQVLFDHLLKWHRERKNPRTDPPRGYFSRLLIQNDKLVFKANSIDVSAIVAFFLNLCPHKMF